MSETNDQAGASPAQPVDIGGTLDDWRALVALDPGGVHPVQVPELAGVLGELDRLRKIEDRARAIGVRKTCRCTTCMTAHRILNGESDEAAAR